MGKRPVGADPERFWALVDQSGDCWPWTRGKTGSGYGSLRWEGRQEGAHRVAYRLAVGPIPAGLFVLHRCDNPPCCNPADLFLGTLADNSADMDAKGRRYAPSSCPQGHPYDEANTHVAPNGHRRCLACRQATVAFPGLLQPGEVAALLSVNINTLKRWSRAGRIQAVRTKGGHDRFHPEEVEAARRRMGLL